MTNYELTVLLFILGTLVFGIFAGVIAHITEEAPTFEEDEIYGDASHYGREEK
jgi:hypothetical protein